jgi:hypothetical protein
LPVMNFETVQERCWSFHFCTRAIGVKDYKSLPDTT